MVPGHHQLQSHHSFPANDHIVASRDFYRPHLTLQQQPPPPQQQLTHHHNHHHNHHHRHLSPFTFEHLPADPQQPLAMQHDSHLAHIQDLTHPPILPPGVDPATVDFRTFYPYIPNEVKHRKRTSRAQLKVLEDVFKKDTKPNGALRKRLAKQLDMTARGVQVWFQNRRAKEKTQSRKNLSMQQSSTSTTAENGTPSPTESLVKLEAPSPHTASTATPHPLDLLHQQEEPQQQHDESSDESTLECHKPPSLAFSNPFRNPWISSPDVSPTQPNSFLPPNFDNLRDSHLLSLRRGSLPVLHHRSPGYSTSELHPPHHAANLSRRRSIDTGIHRLAAHPYAHLAMAKNNAIYGATLVRSPSQLRLAAQIQQPQSPQYTVMGGAARGSMIGYGANSNGAQQQQQRPILAHRASLPHALAHSYKINNGRNLRYPDANQGLTSSPSPPPPAQHSAASANDDPRLFVFSPRLVSTSPIPGPLPPPDYSFGAPLVPPPPSSNTPPMSASAGGEPAAAASYGLLESDVEDGASSAASYISRFGSIASLAGSESSNASSLLSDPSSSSGYDLEARRGSCASGQMVSMMNGLEVNTSNAVDGAAYATAAATTAHEDDDGSLTAYHHRLPHLPMPQQHQHQHHTGAANPYPSPTLTASSPAQAHPPLIMSRVRDLVYALQNQGSTAAVDVAAKELQSTAGPGELSSPSTSSPPPLNNTQLSLSPPPNSASSASSSSSYFYTHVHAGPTTRVIAPPQPPTMSPSATTPPPPSSTTSSGGPESSAASGLPQLMLADYVGKYGFGAVGIDGTGEYVGLTPTATAFQLGDTHHQHQHQHQHQRQHLHHHQQAYSEVGFDMSGATAAAGDYSSCPDEMYAAYSAAEPGIDRADGDGTAAAVAAVADAAASSMSSSLGDPLPHPMFLAY